MFKLQTEQTIIHTHTHTHKKPKIRKGLIQLHPFKNFCFCLRGSFFLIVFFAVVRMNVLCYGKRYWEQHKLCSSLFTLLLGCCMLIFLHVLISREVVDEAAYFSSLPMPEDLSLLPLGVGHVEDLPTSGTSRIPKRIHQTWKTDQIPYSLTAWIK